MGNSDYCEPGRQSHIVRGMAGETVQVSQTCRAFQLSGADCRPPRLLEHKSTQFILLSVTLEPGATLTLAQRELARCLVDGKSDREIAAARGVSVRTVVNQMVALRSKLGVSSRREVVSRVWNACLAVAERTEPWAVGPEPAEPNQANPVGLAVDLWLELISGKLSLADRFDRGGQRYLLTRKNSPSVAAQKQLTHREAKVASLVAVGQQTKVIAYDLGLRPSTVSTHLDKALSKLGARNTAELSVAWGMAHARRE